MSATPPLLQIDDLTVAFQLDDGRQLVAVDGVSLPVAPGKTLGLVGESGCGKSVTAMSILGLLPQPAGRVLSGKVLFQGEDLVHASPGRLHQIRGGQIGMIFQEPMTAMNPVHRVGDQLIEAVLLHQKDLSPQDARDLAIEMLEKVGIPAPRARVDEYPHQLSGGMRQRAMIAMALINRPKLLLADEPTTALDVTVQAQILELIASMQQELGMAVMLITHDLGVVAESCDEVAVMYAGRIVERTSATRLFNSPQHPYTKGLLSSIPTLHSPRKQHLPTIKGNVPSLADLPQGCRFSSRCPNPHTDEVTKSRPPFTQHAPGHWVEACPCFTPAP